MIIYTQQIDKRYQLKIFFIMEDLNMSLINKEIADFKVQSL